MVLEAMAVLEEQHARFVDRRDIDRSPSGASPRGKGHEHGSSNKGAESISRSIGESKQDAVERPRCRASHAPLARSSRR